MEFCLVLQSQLILWNMLRSRGFDSVTFPPELCSLPLTVPIETIWSSIQPGQGSKKWKLSFEVLLHPPQIHFLSSCLFLFPPSLSPPHKCFLQLLSSHLGKEIFSKMTRRVYHHTLSLLSKSCFMGWGSV